MNPKSYDGLSSAHKALIDELGSKQAGPDMAALSWNDYPVYLKYMAGLKFETVTMKPGEEAKMRAAAAKVVEGRIQSMEKAGHPARKFYNKIKALSDKFAKE